MNPFSKELEEQIIGHMMTISLDQMGEVSELLTADSFYTVKCRTAFKLMTDLYSEGVRPDIINLSARALETSTQSLSPAELADMMTSERYVSYVEFMHHLQLLREYEVHRRLLVVSHDLQEAANMGGESVNAACNKAVEALLNIMGCSKSNLSTLNDGMGELYKHVEDLLNGTSNKLSVTTGYSFLDTRGGMQPGDLWIVGGRSSQGKTSFALSVVQHVAQQGIAVAYYSLEMSRLQLSSRITSGVTGITNRQLMVEKMDAPTLKTFNVGVGDIMRWGERIFFDDNSTAGIDSILSSIRSLVLQKDVKVAVIDYMQILNVNMRAANKEQMMGDVARRLKNLARELNITIVALSQLNREGENTDPMPTMSSLRDSGQICEAADVVLLVYRPQYYNEVRGMSISYCGAWKDIDTKDTAQIILAKGRNIGVGDFICGFKAENTLFYDIAPHMLKKKTIDAFPMPVGPL